MVGECIFPRHFEITFALITKLIIILILITCRENKGKINHIFWLPLDWLTSTWSMLRQSESIWKCKCVRIYILNPSRQTDTVALDPVELVSKPMLTITLLRKNDKAHTALLIISIAHSETKPLAYCIISANLNWKGPQINKDWSDRMTRWTAAYKRCM